MVSLEAERFRITSAPFSARNVEGGRGVHISSQISTPSSVPPTRKTALGRTGTGSPRSSAKSSVTSAPEENQRFS